MVALACLALALAVPSTFLAPPTQSVTDVQPTSSSALQAAIDAAQPGDTLVVFGGEYEPIVVDKPLQILGVPAFTLNPCLSPGPAPIACGQPHVTLAGSGSGVVWIGNLVCDGDLNAHVGVNGPRKRVVGAGFDQVWFTSCDIAGAQFTGLNGGAEGAPAIELTGVNFLVLIDTNVEPVDSKTDIAFPPDSPTGIVALGTTVVAVGSTVRGGDGDLQAIDCTFEDTNLLTQGAGGTGVESLRLVESASTVRGGIGSTWYCTGPPGTTGTLPDGVVYIGSERVILPPSAQDCDGDGVPDTVAIASGLATDFDANGVPDVCLAPPLMASGSEISLSQGGAIDLTLTMGPGAATGPFVLLGSASGTAPGTLDPVSGLLLPLNYDAYFELLLSTFGGGVLSQMSGFFDAQGVAQVTLTLPPGLSPSLVGIELHHAFCVIDFLGPIQVNYVSNAVGVRLGG
jgi:hypothetical protein